jgi:flagellar basal-body rod protein FlgB
LSVLRTKMQWHQERQRVLSENVSNSDTPNFKPRDLVAPKFDSSGASAGSMGSLAMMRTSASHITAAGGGGQSFDQNRKAGFQTRPAGNAVNLEDEMLKVSANQMDYAAVTSLYSKSLHLLKTAIGKG